MRPGRKEPEFVKHVPDEVRRAALGPQLIDGLKDDAVARSVFLGDPRSDDHVRIESSRRHSP